MSRLPKIAFLTALLFILFVLAAWAVRLAYVGYIGKIARIVELESKVQDLQRVAHPAWRVREGRFRISTTDMPESTKWTDFRLVSGTNAVQKFENYVWKEQGHIVTAWVSDWTPRSEMAKFEEFSVSSLQGARFEISALARTNESVAMEFKVTFIVE
jgi:hypothetical protein